MLKSATVARGVEDAPGTSVWGHAATIRRPSSDKPGQYLHALEVLQPGQVLESCRGDVRRSQFERFKVGERSEVCQAGVGDLGSREPQLFKSGERPISADLRRVKSTALS